MLYEVITPQLTMERNGKIVSLYVDERAYETSSHREKACAQCHTEVTPSLSRACETVVSKVDCSICHAEQVDDYTTGLHGILHARVITSYSIHYTKLYDRSL